MMVHMCILYQNIISRKHNMDDISKEILKKLGIEIDDNCISKLYEREIFLSSSNYDKVKILLPELKKNISSTYSTSTHSNASEKQKWPLINLVRQILSHYNYSFTPIRKADGYTKDKKKLYKRYFKIDKSPN